VVDGSGNVRTEVTQASPPPEQGQGPEVLRAAVVGTSPGQVPGQAPGPRRWSRGPVPVTVAEDAEDTGEAGCWAHPAADPGGAAGRRWSLPGKRFERRSRSVSTRFPVRLRGGDALRTLDAAPDAVLAMDELGRCLFANAAGARLFGLPAAALVGLDVQQLVPELAVAVRALIALRADGRAAPAPGGASGVELTGMTTSGSTFPVQVWLTPVTSRRRLLVLATVRDLSAQRAAAAATRALLDDVHELRAVVAGVTAAVTERAIVIVDCLGHVTSFNRAAEKLIGRRAEEVAGRPLAELSDPDRLEDARAELRLAPGVDPLLELTRSGLPNRQEWTFLDREGNPRPVSLRITPIGDPRDPIGFVGVARERSATWEPLTSRPSSDRLLLDLDDAETRTLRWQVGGSGMSRRR
jgi:PAS domain S-box-containing protein